MRSLVFALIVVAAAWPQTGSVAPGLIPGPGAFVTSPEVHNDRRVTFRLRAPEATSVIVQGEFATAPQPMRKDENGVWSVTIGPIEPEIYNYNFIIDGVRTIDINNPKVKSGSTPNTIQSIVEIPGNSPAFYDGQRVPHGRVDERWYQSKSLDTLRRIRVYAPPDYDRNQKVRYPVLYLLHGANLDENAWTRLGRANLILDNLLAAKKARPFLVVMPFGYGVPPLSGRGGMNSNMEAFRKDLINDVIPFVESNYRTLSDRDHRAIAGLSMGGGQALTIGLTRLDLFSYIVGMSAAVRPAEAETTFADLIRNPGANPRMHLLWIGCGTEDSLYSPNREFSEFLTKHHIENQFHSSGGAHTFMVWRRYLNAVAPLLFP